MVLFYFLWRILEPNFQSLSKQLISEIDLCFHKCFCYTLGILKTSLKIFWYTILLSIFDQKAVWLHSHFYYESPFLEFGSILWMIEYCTIILLNFLKNYFTSISFFRQLLDPSKGGKEFQQRLNIYKVNLKN